jgi:hypothetical protein
MSAVTVERAQDAFAHNTNSGMSVPKLNSMASKLFAKQADRDNGKVEEKDASASVEEEPMEVDEDVESKQEVESEPDEAVESEPDEAVEDEPVPAARRVGRKPLPRKYRGAVGSIRLQQKNPEPAYRRLTLFRHVKQIVRKEMKRDGVQFSAESVHLIATAMENIMLRKAALGSALTLSGGKTTLLPRYMLLGLKIADKPDLSQWSTQDRQQCDELLPKSQFRNTELDVQDET